jgi:hypothetical protein
MASARAAFRRKPHCSAVTHWPWQHLMDQHISRLDTNTDDSRQQPNHGVGPGLRLLL